MLEALTFTSRTLAVGAGWVLRVLATDDTSGAAADVTVTAAVTLPDGTPVAPAPTVTTSGLFAGVHRAVYVPTLPGRHLATMTDGTVTLHFAALVEDVVDNAGMPDLTDVDNYLGDHSATDLELQQALDQETTAQWRVCRVPATYPADLRGALLRRVQRALAMKGLALAVRENADGDAIVVPGRDPEVRRLEAPFRKVRLG